MSKNRRHLNISKSNDSARAAKARADQAAQQGSQAAPGAEIEPQEAKIDAGAAAEAENGVFKDLIDPAAALTRAAEGEIKPAMAAAGAARTAQLMKEASELTATARAVLELGYQPDARGLRELLLGAADHEQTAEEARAELEADGVDVQGFLAAVAIELSRKYGITVDQEKLDDAYNAGTVIDVGTLGVPVDDTVMHADSCEFAGLDYGYGTQDCCAPVLQERARRDAYLADARTRKQENIDEADARHAEALEVVAGSPLDGTVEEDWVPTFDLGRAVSARVPAETAEEADRFIANELGEPLAHESAHGPYDRGVGHPKWHSSQNRAAVFGPSRSEAYDNAPPGGRGREIVMDGGPIILDEDEPDDLDLLRQLVGTLSSSNNATELAATLWGQDLGPVTELLIRLVEGIEAGHVDIQREGEPTAFLEEKRMSWSTRVERALQELRAQIGAVARQMDSDRDIAGRLASDISDLERWRNAKEEQAMHTRDERLTRIGRLENLGARLVRWAKANDGRNVSAETSDAWSQELEAARESVAEWKP